MQSLTQSPESAVKLAEEMPGGQGVLKGKEIFCFSLYGL